MRKFLNMLSLRRFLSFVLLALLCVSPTACHGASSGEKRAYLASVETGQEDSDGNDRLCTATAIGPHAVLTAAHCEFKTDTIVIRNGADIAVAQIINRLYDGRDHVIYLLDGSFAFPDYVPVKLGAELDITDDVFTFGNPGDFKDFYTRGYVAGTYQQDGDMPADAILFSFATYHGASGSGVFDTDGALVDVLSQSFPQGSPEGVYIQVAGGFALAFKQADIDQAAAWVPPAKK